MHVDSAKFYFGHSFVRKQVNNIYIPRAYDNSLVKSYGTAK